jgi:hypothetical protein
MGQSGAISLFPQSDQLTMLSAHWGWAKDELARRHYSARNKRRLQQRQFVGPGRKLVLLSSDGQAVFAWRDFIDDTVPPQTGYNCSIFRNEGTVQSSLLITEAAAIVRRLWGNSRCYTLVNAAKIRSTNPGFCFIMAGWQRCGVTKTGKIILELLPMNL